MEALCICLCDVSVTVHTYSCQCHPHPELPPWFVRWRLWGFSDPFYLMSAPGEMFLNYWTGRVGDASGVLQAWVGLPLGLVWCAWFSIGRKKTDEQDELMNTALMPAKNNMKDDQNHALFCNQLTSSWENNFKRMQCLFTVLCISTSEKNKGFEQTR